MSFADKSMGSRCRLQAKEIGGVAVGGTRGTIDNGEREWVKVARELASPGTKCAPLMACHSVGCEKSTHTQMDAHTRNNFGWLKLLGLCLTVERLVLDTADLS